MEDDKKRSSEQEEQKRDKPKSRFDRLLSAKEQADREAEAWQDNEGQALPSADREPPQHPFIEEPPVEEGDTPTGDHTPPGGMPRINPEEVEAALASADEEPAPPTEDPSPPEPPARKRPEPSFRHPTDPPPEPEPESPTPEPELPQDEDVPFKITPSEAGWDAPLEQTDRAQDTPSKQSQEAEDVPLPRPVPHEDPDATIATPSAFRDPPAEPTIESRRPDVTQPAQRSRAPAPPPVSPVPPAAEVLQTPPPPSSRASYAGSSRPITSEGIPVAQPKRKRQQRTRIQFSWGCLLRTAGLTLLGALVAVMLGGGAAAIYYAQVTAPTFQGITTVEDLQARALQFETTRIRDSQGNVLFQLNDPEGGFRDYVELEEISPWVIYSTVATEEREYFTNPGFSIPAIIRAVIQNFREGQTISGASTITQQLTRALLLPEEERTERTYARKIKEIFLAAELNRRFSKEEVLELYLNQIYYGNLAYGIESASQLYFDKPSSELTAAEAAFLVGIPQAPSIWDPVQDLEAAYIRQEQVLQLMLEAGAINTGDTGLVLPTFNAEGYAAAKRESDPAQNPEWPAQFEAADFAARYPHWVVYIIQQLEADEAIGPSIYTSGYDVYTTLDPRLQTVAEDLVDQTIAGLTDRNVNNASVVVVDVDTGAILAMVGSRDFDDETIDGQVNIALTPQQPGSSIKPFTYLTAFREGWNPAHVIWDVPIQYEIPGFGVYEPVNYGDSGFAGPVTARYALANSLNIPAVLTVDAVGVNDLLQTLNDVGVESLGDSSNPNNFGLSLTLGAGEVTLLEWTNAYATIANGGTLRPVYGIRDIQIDGQSVEGYPYEVPSGEQVLDPVNVFLLQSVLTDYEARVPAFGRNTPLSPEGYIAGAKTGTTNDFRDNWTMGFTSEIATGVWVGNTDNSPMFNVTGVTGAGPIWRGVMDAAHLSADGAPWYQAGDFPRPGGVELYEVCRDDGMQPSDFCRGIEPSQLITDWFDSRYPPPEGNQEGLYRQLQVDSFTGLIANDFCPDFATEELFLALPNPSQLIDVPSFARDWIVATDRGRNWAVQRDISFDTVNPNPPPTEACGPDTPRPQIAITNPSGGETLEGNLVVRGTAEAPNFAYYIVDFGLSANPQGWAEVQGRTAQQVSNGPLGQIDLTPFAGETVTLRLMVFDQNGNSAETRVTFQVAEATPTPTPTEEPEEEEEEATPTRPAPATVTPEPDDS